MDNSANTSTLTVNQLDSPVDAQAGPTPWAPRPLHRYRGYRLRAKRGIDVVLGTVLLLLALPILMIVLGSVRLTSSGPALFRQRRVGLSGRPFQIIKVRTMHVDAERRLAADPDLRSRYVRHGYKLPLREDPRITRLGAFLRRTSIDELPQLWNVVRGEMSLVGPRPVLAEELAEYGPYASAYRMAKPGLTGPWQVAGRDALRFPYRARIDAEYIDQWSLTNDIVILAKTLPAVLKARGVS